MKRFIISGGLGDTCNELAKVVFLRNQLGINKVLYVRDIFDDKLLDGYKHLTRDYVGWVRAIYEKNGFMFDFINADQKVFCEQTTADDIVLGPNMDGYELKIWEERRGMFVGIRPKEHQFTISGLTKLSFDSLERCAGSVCLQVRFGHEYPAKVPGASWSDLNELVHIIKFLIEKGINIALVGETALDLSSLEKRVVSFVNAPIIDQYNAILSCKAGIGFSGFFSNLNVVTGKKTLRLFWDEPEFILQTPKVFYNNITHCTHDDIYQKLETFTLAFAQDTTQNSES